MATYHRRSYGFYSKESDPRLEISPEVLPILDEVILTFVWVEHKRRRRERSNANSGWDAAPSGLLSALSEISC
jgi:hypothetical protein